MNKVESYIDICLIDEYAHKDFENGYSLDLDSLPQHEISNFLDTLMQNDTTVRDLVLHHMQELINDRLPECEVNDRRHAGITLTHLSNGDTMLERGAEW